MLAHFNLVVVNVCEMSAAIATFSARNLQEDSPLDAGKSLDGRVLPTTETSPSSHGNIRYWINGRIAKHWVKLSPADNGMAAHDQRW